MLPQGNKLRKPHGHVLQKWVLKHKNNGPAEVTWRIKGLSSRNANVVCHELSVCEIYVGIQFIMAIYFVSILSSTHVMLTKVFLCFYQNIWYYKYVKVIGTSIMCLSQWLARWSADPNLLHF